MGVGRNLNLLLHGGLMKLCVFSDVHGNADVFHNALPLMINEKADAYVCLGDSCGYYFGLETVYQMLNEIPGLIVLKGNHEQMFDEACKGNQEARQIYLKRYGPSLEKFLEKKNEEIISWISQLPVQYEILSEGAAFFHGSPRKPVEEYIYPDTDLSCFSQLPYRLVCLGHTHHRMVRHQGNTLFVNPGSLGQPRDGHWPSYAMIDTKTLQVVFKDIHFDVRAFMDRVRNEAHDYPLLYSVLKGSVLMVKPVVLISGIGGDVSQSVATVLKKQYHLIGCDMQEFKPYRHFFRELCSSTIGKEQ